MYKRILVPLDGSKTSAAALKEALKFAKEQGARVCLTHVYERIKHVVTEGVIDLTPALRRQGEQLLAEAASRARKAGVKATIALVEAGSRRIPAAIVEQAAAEGADLIAMGTHGRRGFERLMLGSVADGVARRATVPVLLLPRR
jgi:nucleotide-binding universal stress UspA family protein